MINEAFERVYQSDPNLQRLLGESVHKLGPHEKKQLLLEIQERGIEGLMEEEQEASYVVHNGKRYDRVQIEEDNNEYLMDEEGNLYDTNFQCIGQANTSDADDI